MVSDEYLKRWQEIKEYYETKWPHKGISFRDLHLQEKWVKMANEIHFGKDTRQVEKPWNRDAIAEFAHDLKMDIKIGKKHYLESTYPSYIKYGTFAAGIAVTFLKWELEFLDERIKEGKEDYIEIAIRLNWKEMIPENLQNMFLF